VSFVIGQAAVDAGAVIAFLIAIPLLLLSTAIYTALCSGLTIGMICLVLTAMRSPGSISRISPDLAMASDTVRLAILAGLLLLFWLTVRLSCTTASMAVGTRINPFFGIVESWRMTRRAQWRIMGHLAIVGLLLSLLLGGLTLAFGAGIATRFQPGGVPIQIGSIQWIAGVVVAIPLAYLNVLVPAGIYRELRPFIPEVEIFA